MLYFRRICLLVALALTFGANDLFAQAPAGISVRIVSPADSAWVGIGGKIVVEVSSQHLTNGIRAAGRTDTSFVLGGIDEVSLLVDATPNDKAVARGNALTGLTGIPSATPGDGVYICSANRTESHVVSGNRRTVTWNGTNCRITAVINDFSGSTHSARYTFQIKQALDTPPTNPGSHNFRAGVSGIYAVAAADVGAPGEVDGTYGAVANVETGGDGKFLRIDTGRPIQTAAYVDSVVVAGKVNDAKFKIGAEIELAARIFRFPADVVAIKLGLFGFDVNYAPGYMSDPDSALVNSLTEFKIKAGAIEGADDPILLKTVTVEENAFKIVGDPNDDDNDEYNEDKKTILMDNLRFKVGVFFVDRAGNIGAETADAADAQPFSGDRTYTVDSKRPVINIRYPVDRPDSNRFTGKKVQSFDYRENNGQISNDKDFNFRPLELKVHEDLDSLFAIAKSGTKMDRADITSEYEDIGAFEKVSTNNAFTRNVRSDTRAKGGKKIDLTIEARDLVGNVATKTVSNVWHDQDEPNPVRWFPKKADLGDDPINESTRHPVLRFNEALDSLSVRFIEDTTNNPDRAIQKVASANLTKVNQDITVTVNQTLMHGRDYWFQIYARDLAGNVHISKAEEFTYNREFVNPEADSFKIVATEGDTAIAGYQLPIDITALNAEQTRRAKKDRLAVTYRSPNVRVSAWDGDEIASSVVISGTGVTKDEGGYFTLNAAAWNAGKRTIRIKSNKVLDGLAIKVEEIESSTVDGMETMRAVFSNSLGDITIDEGDMRKFVLTAWEDGGEASTVAGEFKVRVVPADSLDNPSVKYFAGSEAITSATAIGDPALFDEAKPSKLSSIAIELSAIHPDARVPQGPQSVMPGGTSFTVIAPPGTGEGLTISAQVANATPGETAKHLSARGSVTVDYTGAAPTASDSLAAPASLTVRDVPGDQGHYIEVTFPLSSDHAEVDSYRLYREMDLGDGEGPRWIKWGKDFQPSRADLLYTDIVGVPDGMATHWAIQAIGNRPSSPTPAGKLSAAIIESGRTQTAEPVAALDNMPPEAATDVMLDVDASTISWTLSPSEGPTGEIYTNTRTGQEGIAILGVKEYEIWVGLSEDAMYSVGKVGVGVSSFALSGDVIVSLVAQGAITTPDLQMLLANDLLGVMVRVNALDETNSTPSMIYTVEKLTRRAFTSADGDPVFIVNLEGDMTVGFDDFMAFAAAFDTRDGEDAWNIQADLNDDGTVDFADFILFVQSYGKTAQGPSSKPVILPPGVNENAEFSLRLGSERVVVGQNVFVDVSLANVQALMGYGFVLNYDADKFEFVEAAPTDQDLLKSTGGETPLFSSIANESGQVSIANAVVNGSEISGGGDIVRLTFRVLQEFSENARFEIAEGLVFDPQQLSNPAVVAGVLDVQTTPTEFALLQNFPNPFNPETTIGYELAESADVTLQIYNVVGQVVRTLIAAESQAAGRYQIRWDGMDDRGVSVSSGIYFYRISAGEFQTVRKLMLLK